MKRVLMIALGAATISPLTSARADYDSWGCGGLVANAGAFVDYPGPTTVCTSLLPAGRQQFMLAWNRGAVGVVSAEAVDAEGTPVASMACGVSVGIALWCAAQGPFDEVAQATIGVEPLSVIGFLGRLRVPSDTTVTLRVAPEGVGGGGAAVAGMVGQFRTGSL